MQRELVGEEREGGGGEGGRGGGGEGGRGGGGGGRVYNVCVQCICSSLLKNLSHVYCHHRNRRVWPKQTHSHKSFGHVDEAKMIHANLPMMEIHGYIQFKMDKNAYRMIPLANSEDYLYNRGLLQRLREVGGQVWRDVKCRYDTV